MLAVDRDQVQRIRDNVLASFGECHRRPAFPFGDGARDDHGARRGREDACSKSLVRPDPRVDVQAVAARPSGEAFHGRQWIPALEGWPDRRDDTLEAGGGRSLPEGGERLPRQPAALPIGFDGRGHDAQRVGPGRVFVVGYRADQGAVIAVRQGAYRSVPSNWHSPASGYHLAVVEEQHIVLREVCLDAAYVFGDDRVVEDELRPDGAEGIPGLPVEIMTVARRDHLYVTHDVPQAESADPL